MRFPIINVCLWALVGFAVSGEVRAQSGPARGRIQQGTLQDGDAAPAFSLHDVDGKATVKLADLRGKPVVLIFGSCTCPPFVRSLESTRELQRAYQDKVHFYLIYIREAHPTDGRAIPGNAFQVKSPATVKERQAIAKKFAERLDVSIPILVDTIEDDVEKAYAGWPNRMYLLDAEGKIADKGSAGPGGVASSARRAADVLDKLLSGGN